MKCKNCPTELKAGMEIEYSKEICEYFCSPACATDYYYDYMGSHPSNMEEVKSSER